MRLEHEPTFEGDDIAEHIAEAKRELERARADGPLPDRVANAAHLAMLLELRAAGLTQGEVDMVVAVGVQRRGERHGTAAIRVLDSDRSFRGVMELAKATVTGIGQSMLIDGRAN